MAGFEDEDVAGVEEEDVGGGLVDFLSFFSSSDEELESDELLDDRLLRFSSTFRLSRSDPVSFFFFHDGIEAEDEDEALSLLFDSCPGRANFGISGCLA